MELCVRQICSPSTPYVPPSPPKPPRLPSPSVNTLTPENFEKIIAEAVESKLRLLLGKDLDIKVDKIEELQTNTTENLNKTKNILQDVKARNIVDIEKPKDAGPIVRPRSQSPGVLLPTEKQIKEVSLAATEATTTKFVNQTELVNSSESESVSKPNKSTSVHYGSSNSFSHLNSRQLSSLLSELVDRKLVQLRSEEKKCLDRLDNVLEICRNAERELREVCL
jgi:hypothetical protein